MAEVVYSHIMNVTVHYDRFVPSHISLSPGVTVKIYDSDIKQVDNNKQLKEFLEDVLYKTTTTSALDMMMHAQAMQLVIAAFRRMGIKKSEKDFKLSFKIN